MFDHLDDPHPWSPTEDLQRRSMGRGRSLRRRRRLIGGALAALGCSLAAVAVGGALVDRNLDRIDRIDVTSVGPDDDEVRLPDGPVTILLAGADDDTGLRDPAPDEDRPGTARSDTVVVARLDPAAHRLTVLSLPRDLWVDIPGHGEGRINAALALGGPELLVDTVEGLLDLDVDHYVQIDFAGAVAIGDALDGVQLEVTAPLRDRSTGLALEVGCQRIGGLDLLALGRSRHTEVLADGRWVPDPGGDLGRIDRQQAIGAAVLADLTRLADADPTELYRLTEAMAEHLTVDATLDRGALLGLARSLQGVELWRAEVSVRPEDRGGAAVLEATLPPADALAAARPVGPGPAIDAVPDAC